MIETLYVPRSVVQSLARLDPSRAGYTGKLDVGELAALVRAARITLHSVEPFGEQAEWVLISKAELAKLNRRLERAERRPWWVWVFHYQTWFAAAGGLAVTSLVSWFING